MLGINSESFLFVALINGLLNNLSKPVTNNNLLFVYKVHYEISWRIQCLSFHLKYTLIGIVTYIEFVNFATMH